MRALNSPAVLVPLILFPRKGSRQRDLWYDGSMDNSAPKKSRGRPAGRFAERAEKLRKLVLRLRRPTCIATSQWLADAMGCSIRQIARYLAYLRKEGRIETKNERSYDVKAKRFWSRRWIDIADSVWDRPNPSFPRMQISITLVSPLEAYRNAQLSQA